MKKQLLIVAVVVAVGLSAGQALAARLFLSTQDMSVIGTTPAGNPNITLNIGQTATIYLYADLNNGVGYPEEMFDPFEVLLGLGLDVVPTVSNVVNFSNLSAPNYQTNKPAAISKTYRWDSVHAPTVGAEISGGAYAAISSSGIRPDKNPVDSATSYDGGWVANLPSTQVQRFHVLSFNLTGLADRFTDPSVQSVTTQIFLSTGTHDGWAFVDPTAPMYLGIGDVALGETERKIPGSRSGLADLTVTVIPEPASLGALVIGGLLLFPRRRPG
ncbi:MAG: hypothetical protein IT443_08235 [Phycisphaeraceae bacterium]|nr:hypothetical protein [Phycisphaeraceae bacterium]